VLAVPVLEGLVPLGPGEIKLRCLLAGAVKSGESSRGEDGLWTVLAVGLSLGYAMEIVEWSDTTLRAGGRVGVGWLSMESKDSVTYDEETRVNSSSPAVSAGAFASFEYDFWRPGVGLGAEVGAAGILSEYARLNFHDGHQKDPERGHATFLGMYGYVAFSGVIRF
jgi:hypothetical protein